MRTSSPAKILCRTFAEEKVATLSSYARFLRSKSKDDIQQAQPA